jgi:DNA repair exonuclease SbcCD ATPase subunit
MAVGVPETDVFAAADRVLERGERPTVERVRAELGRGSPARVGQLLETWWEALAQRLAGHTQLPDIPSEIAGAFAHVWKGAVAAAHTQVETQVAAERAALAELVARADAAIAREQIATEAADQVKARADDTVAQLTTRLTDLQQLIEAQRAQLHDLQSQRAALTLAQTQALAQQDAARAVLEDLRDSSAREYAALAAHAQSVEDRAHREVDLARSELKAARKRIETLERETSSRQRIADQRVAQLQTQLLRATQALARAPARKPSPAAKALSKPTASKRRA